MTSMPFDDPTFWDGASAYEKVAHAFTTAFALRALHEAALPPHARVLDVATGTGALAIAAARTGAHVLATDFSAGMVRRVLSQNVPNVAARQMDGQKLDLPDGSFDAAFSMFGVMLFADARAGLAEMARVTRPGGLGVVATWPHRHGAAANLLLAEICAALYPELEVPDVAGAMAEWRDPSRFRTAMETAGFGDLRIVEHVHDFLLDPAQLDMPDPLFAFSAFWPLLEAGRRAAVLATIRDRLPAGGGPLPVPSTALIAIGERR